MGAQPTLPASASASATGGTRPPPPPSTTQGPQTCGCPACDMLRCVGRLNACPPMAMNTCPAVDSCPAANMNTCPAVNRLPRCEHLPSCGQGQAAPCPQAGHRSCGCRAKQNDVGAPGGGRLPQAGLQLSGLSRFCSDSWGHPTSAHARARARTHAHTHARRHAPPLDRLAAQGSSTSWPAGPW